MYSVHKGPIPAPFSVGKNVKVEGGRRAGGPGRTLLVQPVAISIFVFGCLFGFLCSTLYQRPWKESVIQQTVPQLSRVQVGWVPSNRHTSAPPVDALEGVPSLTIFTAPRPYVGRDSDTQLAALLSWLSLKPQPKVVLFGNHPTFHEVAERFAGQVMVETRVDCNFRGISLVHSMLFLTRSASTDMVAMLSSDTVLFDLLFEVVTRVRHQVSDFLLVASRWEISPLDAKLECDSNGKVIWRHPDSSSFLNTVAKAEVMKAVRASGKLHAMEADIFVWTNPSLPLVNRTVPSFVYGRGYHDSWLVQMAVREHVRTVVDTSDFLGAFVPGLSLAGWEKCEGTVANRSSLVNGTSAALPQLSLWNQAKAEGWEVLLNRHLALAEGNISSGDGPTLFAPLRLMACETGIATGPEMCFVQRARPGLCSCELSAYASRAELDPIISGQSVVCGNAIPEGSRQTLPIKVLGNTSLPLSTGRPRTLEELLPLVANENKNVLLLVASYHYAETVMSFICRLRKLGVQTPLVAAMDVKMYVYAFLRGIAVYLEESAVNRELEVGEEGCGFSTRCFRRATQGKTRATLHILRLGYNVILSDPDIMWYTNPIPEITSFGPGVFPAQSDIPVDNKPANAEFRPINSGFYYARSEPLVIEAFEAIILAAINGPDLKDNTQQHWFNEVLCSGNSSEARRGTNECIWKGLTVKLLNRNIYPNGGFKMLFYRPNVTKACEEVGCAIIHNNWLEGYKKKVARFKKLNYWFYDDHNLCIYDFNSTLWG
eukprot:TRINITY_DN5001_c0_g1_i6.p1 TRINITY_DN5001_c0_g1~~TRINITY_DN5001_c0_g1_i6.p1  ORF type:complete len:769 (+),score=46.21 TRINITY_DN5001_c0_g1_i6:328-2634(+)